MLKLVKETLFSNFSKEIALASLREIQGVRGFSIEKNKKDLIDIIDKLKTDNKISENVATKLKQVLQAT